MLVKSLLLAVVARGPGDWSRRLRVRYGMGLVRRVAMDEAADADGETRCGRILDYL